MLSDEELRLEVLKIATQADLCSGSADTAVAVARKLWEFMQPMAPEGSHSAPS